MGGSGSSSRSPSADSVDGGETIDTTDTTTVSRDNDQTQKTDHVATRTRRDDDQKADHDVAGGAAPRTRGGDDGQHATLGVAGVATPTCRICFEGADESLGKLITPCDCKGSSAMIHERCLERWQERCLLDAPNNPRVVAAREDQGHLDRAVYCTTCHAK